MEAKKKGNDFFKLFCKFVSQPSPKSNTESMQRTHSFEYMELSHDNPKNVKTKEEKSQKFNFSSNRDNTDLVFEAERDLPKTNKPFSHDYLARLATSQPIDNPLLLLKNSAREQCDAVTSNFLETAETEKIPKKENTKRECRILSYTSDDTFHRHTSSGSSSTLPESDADSIDEWRSSFVSGYDVSRHRVQEWFAGQECSAFPPQNDQDQGDEADEYYPQYVPTLDCIEEADESELSPLEDALHIYPGNLLTSQSLGWSMDRLSSQSFGSSLRRSNTLENLSMDERENYDCAEGNSNKDEDFQAKESSNNVDEEPVIVASVGSIEVASESPILMTSDSPIRLTSDITVLVASASPIEVSSNSPIRVSSDSPIQVTSKSTIRVSSGTPVHSGWESPILVRPDSPKRPDSPVRSESPKRSGSPLVGETDKQNEDNLNEDDHCGSRNISNNASNHPSLTDSAYSSHEHLNALHLSTPDITKYDEDAEEELQYIPVSYAEVRARRKKKWGREIKRSASDVFDSYAAGERAGAKLSTLKKRLVRKLSKRGKKPQKSQPDDGDKDNSSKHEKKTGKLSRQSSLRVTMMRWLRRIRSHGNYSNDNSIRDRTWSMPTHLDTSSSDDFYVFESESTSDAYT